MAQANPFDQFDTAPVGQAPKPASAPKPLRGPAPKPEKPEKPDVTYRQMDAEEVKQRGLDPTKVWKIDSNGNFSAVGDSVTAPKPTKQLPSSAADKYETAVSGALDFDRIVNTYKPEYAGNTFTGDAENMIQKRFSGFGTPGQQQWWADARSNDNLLRNALFGASLTGGEQKAFDATTISPDMDPELVRQNLTRRREIVIGALRRRTNFLKANGYEPEAIDALLGEGALLLQQEDQAGAAATAGTGNDRPPPGGDGGDQTRVATGNRRFVEDKEFNDTIYSMWKSGKSWPELQAYAQTRGYRLDPPNAEALKYYGERGQSPFAPAGRYEELSTRQKLAATPVAGYASGATNALTFGLSDELYGAGSAAMGGDYEQARDEFQGAKRAIADMNPVSDVVGNITGGALLPVGAGGMLGRTAAGGVISNAIRANPIKAGAAYGAAYGAGESNENRLAGAALGGAAGGAGGVLGKYVIEPGITRAVNSRIGQATLETLGDGVNAIRARRGVAPEGFDPEVVAAGERQGIPIRRPDAIPSLRNDMAAAEASPYGGGLVQNALRNDTDAVQARLAEIGGPGTSMVGDSVNYEMGQQGRKIAKGYIERTRVQKNDLYGEAEQLAGGQRITPDNAIAAVDRNIAELEAAGANTNAAQIGYLKGLREDLQKADGFSISEFQRLRSNAKGKIKGDNALTSSDADRRLDDVVKAFTGDAEAQLPQGAAAKLAEADEFYAKRQKFIEGTLQKLIGTRKNPASAEDVGKRLMDMSRSKADRDRLAGVLREASQEQRDDFSATIAEMLGMGRNGEFSLGALATNIQKMPRNLRQLVFGDEGARALDDLQAIARAKSDTKGGLNSSRTGVVAMRDTLKRLMLGMAGGGAVGGASGDVTTAVVGGVAVPAVTELVASIGQRRAAKLLLNPDFTKWMRQAPKAATPKQAAAYIEDLRERLGANPETAAIVNNVVPLFEQRFLGSVSQSATAAAAKEEE